MNEPNSPATSPPFLKIDPSLSRQHLVFSLLATGLAIFLWWGLGISYENTLNEQKRSVLQTRLDAIGTNLTSTITRRQALLTGLAVSVKTHTIKELRDGHFFKLATGLRANDPVIRVIQYFPTEGPVLLYPIAGNEAVVARTLNDLINDDRPDVRADVARAIQTREITLSNPYELRQGGRGIVARLAVHDTGQFLGIVVVILNLEPLMAVPGLQPVPADIQDAIKDTAGKVFYGDASIFNASPVLSTIVLPEGAWTLAAAPAGGWAEATRAQMIVFWIVGLVIAVLIGAISYLVVNRQALLAQRLQTQERELNERGEKLRLAVEASNIGFFEWDVRTDAVRYSTEWKKQIGFRADEIKDDIHEWQSRIHPDDREATLTQIDAFVRDHVLRFETEFRLRHKDDSYRWILARGLLEEDSTGEAVRMISCHIDVTRQKEYELALAASEHLFRGLAEYSPDFIMLYDRQCRHVYENPAGLRISGLSEADIIGKTHREAGFSEELSDLWETDIQHVFEKGVTSQRSFEWESASGKIVLDWRLSPIFGTDGKVDLVLGVSRDITTLKQAEETLRESEAKFRSLFQNNDATMLLIDPANGAIIDANPAACAFYGWSHAEITAKNIGEINTLSDEEIAAEMQNAVVAQRHSFQFIHRLANEQTRNVEVFSSPVQHGGRTLLFSIIHDITERKRAEEENLAAQIELKRLLVEADLSRLALLGVIEDQKMAEEKINQLNADLEQRVRSRTLQLEVANKELEAFSYSVSHDLRAPLRGINGWSEALAEDYQETLDEQARTYLNRIRTETQRMGQLIDDLLSLSRVSRSEMQRTTVNLTSIAQGIAGRLLEAYPDRSLTFAIQPGLTASGDSRLLDIVLTNLLSNACKFTEPMPSAEVEFGQTSIDGRNVYYIRDNGVGFDMAYAKNLFGAFQRLHRQSEFPGTGIGLATVQRIIHRHGGKVWAEAKKDEGATFFFTLEENA